MFPGPDGFKIHLSPGSKVVPMERAISGHMMIPCSDFSKVGKKPSEQKEVNKRWMLYSGGPVNSSISCSSSSNAPVDSQSQRP